jgi:Spy/CpxP family protein refolding chaperone
LIFSSLQGFETKRPNHRSNFRDLKEEPEEYSYELLKEKELPMKLRYIFIVSCLAGLLAMPAVAGQSSGSPKDSAGHASHFWSDLGLSQQQKDQMKALRKDMRATLQANFKQSKDLRIKIKAEFLKPNPDPTVINAFSTQLAQLHKQMTDAIFTETFKAKQILTPDQFKKFLDRAPRFGFAAAMHKHGWHHGQKDGGAAPTAPAAGQK